VRRPLRLGAIALTALAAGGLAGGCGAERQPAPNPDEPAAPGRFGRLVYSSAGVAFQAPGAWSRSPGAAPLVATVTSGRATIAVWRYPRKEPLPAARGELQPLVKALIEAARARDRTLKIDSGRIVKVGSIEGIELVGTERISGQTRRVRSLHVFDHKAEVVVDAYAPPAEFDQLNRTVFQPVFSSLMLSAPNGRGQQGQQGGQRRP
jgi:hypothetical protein